jgi:hypothetical protein
MCLLTSAALPRVDRPKGELMRSLFRRAVPAALWVAGVVIVGAPVASASTSSNAGAVTLAKAALAATEGATSFTFQGNGVSDNQKVEIDVTVSAKAAFGVLTYSGQSTTLRRVKNTIYAKGTKGFLEQQGVSAADAAVEANQWFKVPSTDTSDFASIDHFLTVSGVLSGLLSTKGTDLVTSSTRSTLRGQAVDILVGTFDGQKGTFYVASHGKPYILRILQPDGSAGGGTVDILNIDKPVHVSAPSTIENG